MNIIDILYFQVDMNMLASEEPKATTNCASFWDVLPGILIQDTGVQAGRR